MPSRPRYRHAFATAALLVVAALSPAPALPSPTDGTTPSLVDASGARATVRLISGVRYATRSPSQTLDLVLPAWDGRRLVPVVVLIHGGGFRTGSAAGMATYARRLAAAGLAAVSVNYRLAGEAAFPAGAQDVKAAVRWTRANASRLGLDPARIGAWGRSAGGWMAVMLGVTGHRDTIFDDPSLGNPGRSSSVRAVVSWYGPTNFATMDRQRRDVVGCGSRDRVSVPDSPESGWLGVTVGHNIRTRQANLLARAARARALPAWYLVHGDADCVVPVGQTRTLARALMARDRPPAVTVSVLRGATHGDDRFDRTRVESTIRFLRAALR